MSLSVLSLCPTLGSAVYCAFLKSFAMRPKPIPLWHLLFETPGLCSFIIVFLRICLNFWLFSNLLCYVNISSLLYKEHHQISRFTPTHTPLVPHLAWLEASADTHKHTHKETNAERCVQSSTQSHFTLLCCLIIIKTRLCRGFSL